MSRRVILPAAVLGLGALTAAPAAAETFTLVNGSTVNVDRNALNQGASGTLNGTITTGGVTTNVSCSYDAASGTLTGSAACSQILGGSATGGLDLNGFINQIVAARLNTVADLSAETNLDLFNDVVRRRIGTDTVLTIQADREGAAAAAQTAFGAPRTGAWGIAGAGFFEDERLGREKDGDSLLLTVGVDRSAGNLLMGGTLGYVDNDIDLESLNGDLSSKGWLAGAYMTFVMSSSFSVTASASYVDSNVDLERTAAGVAITSDYGQKELSAGVNATWFQRIGNMGLSLIGGLTWSDWKTGDYVDSSGMAFASASEDNWQASGGTVLMLLTESAIRPYATATYGHYLSDRAFGGDRGSLTVGAGLSMGSGAFTGSLEVTKVLLVEDVKQSTIGLHLRFLL